MRMLDKRLSKKISQFPFLILLPNLPSKVFSQLLTNMALAYGMILGKIRQRGSIPRRMNQRLPKKSELC